MSFNTYYTEYKNKLKMGQNLHVRVITKIYRIKYRYKYNFGWSSDFLDMRPKAQSTKEK